MISPECPDTSCLGSTDEELGFTRADRHIAEAKSSIPQGILTCHSELEKHISPSVQFRQTREVGQGCLLMVQAELDDALDFSLFSDGRIVGWNGHLRLVTVPKDENRR
jgi:hypothetical protein